MLAPEAASEGAGRGGASFRPSELELKVGARGAERSAHSAT